VPRFPCVIPVTSFQYLNVRNVELSGVEVEGAYDWGAGFVSVAATHVEGVDPATRLVPNTVPPDRVSTTLGLRFLDNALTVGSRVTLVDRRPVLVPGASIISTKGYALWDLFASYQVNDTVRADFVVQNILDKRYTQYLNSLPNPGTVAKVAVTMKFATR
jgi:hemoglobin/transferrin/lactoferrin receptor protein